MNDFYRGDPIVFTDHVCSARKGNVFSPACLSTGRAREAPSCKEAGPCSSAAWDTGTSLPTDRRTNMD